ncbi:uncharacterized protein LOC114868984 isoform X2 [Betta splendens]|uniref:Uncharacterized protein LOC114868984 isoform X2 n=1 Tax=Betta splendens TaxID=158456 RepID=A0A9W2X942_BETSP|nr:uncharacterized protein LOC114868984 isoform X2 [Betta splendens]
MEYLDAQGTRQLLTTNQKINGSFTENPKICIEEYQSKEEYSQSCSDIYQPEINGQYRYNINTGPIVVETPHDQPYHLHPPYVQSSEEIQGCHKNNLQQRSPHNELRKLSRFSVVNESDRGSQRESIESCNNGFVNAKNVGMYLQVTEDTNALELQTCYQQEPRQTQQSSSQKQKLSKSTLSPKDVWNKKPGRKTKDIVERNKITLGHNTSRSNFGSYVRIHMLKQERPHDVNEVPDNTGFAQFGSG